MFLELTVRYFRRIATPSFIIFWLVMGVVGSVVYGLANMVRSLTFNSLFWLAFWGVLFGWLFARTRLKSWLSAILLLLIGLEATYVWVAGLVAPLLHLIRALLQIGWGYLWQREDFVLDPTPLQLAGAEIALSVNNTWVALQEWLGSLSSANPVFRSTAVLLVWGLVIWMIAAWAGWMQKRHENAILSILPGVLLLVSALGYTYEDTTSLIPLFLSMLLLVALTWLNKNERRWQDLGIDYPDDARLDSIVAFVGISVLLLAVASFVPRISIRKVIEMVHEFTSPQIEQAAPLIESFGIEPYQPSIGRFGSLLAAGLPRSHLIGAGPELSEQLVMSVKITAGLPPGAEVDAAIPLYWRGLTYDRYTGVGWDSSDVALRHYRPDQQVGVFERPGYWIIEQEVRFVDDNELLFAAGDLISVDQNYRVAWRSAPWLSDVEQFPGDFFGASADEQAYRAQSFVPVLDENTLRGTAWDYPEWVRENYILVPIETPQRVINLTRQLVAEVDNPYDRARVIEQYLRQFEYTTDLPQPPPDQDVVDHFLFDLKKGYCDYFATTMVIMARAADLPARLVIGYARGTYDSANDRYVVTEAEAHSWPEIYFAGVGWIPFEPTSGRKAIARSQSPLQFPGDSVYVIEPESLMGGLQPLFGSWPLTFGIIVLGLGWIGMVWITLDEWFLKRLTPVGTATRLYNRLYRHGRRLGVPASRKDTPFEFADSLRIQVASFPGKSLGRKSMRQADRGIADLTGAYVQVRFSPQTPDKDQQARLLAIWQRLRRQLLLARGLYWLRKLKPRKSTDLESHLGVEHE